MNTDEIALRVWYANNTCMPADGMNKLKEFAHALLAELSKDAPVAEDIRKDAERYLWLKSQKGLALSSCGGSWIKGNIKFNASHRLCANGTAYAPYETLDETLDAAIAAAPKEK